MADYVKKNYDYDRILFVPAYMPPHKKFDTKMAKHRFQMVKLALGDEKFFEISDFEFQNERFSYTYLTILELYKKYKIDGKIGFIIGSDAFEKIESWYETDKLKELVNFIVFPRETRINGAGFASLQNKGYKFTLTKMEPIELSSTELREKLVKKQSVSAFVPDTVLEYINKNELYRQK